MTDEKRLQDMMAGPGPAPVHDANGWPVEMVDGPTYDAMACALEEHLIRDPRVGMVYRVVCRHGEWDGFDPRRALQHATRWHANPPTRVPAEDSAGPAAPSFKVGQRVEHVVDGVLAGVGIIQRQPFADGFDVLFDDGDVHVVRLSQLRPAAPSSASTSGAGGLAELLARLQAEVQSLADMAQATADVIEGQLAAELDSRYGADRAKGGEPRD